MEVKESGFRCRAVGWYNRFIRSEEFALRSEKFMTPVTPNPEGDPPRERGIDRSVYAALREKFMKELPPLPDKDLEEVAREEGSLPLEAFIEELERVRSDTREVIHDEDATDPLR